jgi:tetratricopeptide (TPR) repeat protein
MSWASRSLGRWATPLLSASLYLACSLGEARVARADEAESEQSNDARARARDLAVKGIELLEAKDWQTAHDLLGQAYELYPAPTVAVLDAKALQQLGRISEALTRYEQAAANPVDEDSPKPFRRAVREAKRERDKLIKQLGTLSVVVHNATAAHTVKVNGELLARAEWSQPRRVDPGTYVVAALEDDRVEVEQSLEIGPGANAQLVLSLSHQPPPPAPPPTTNTLPARSNALGWTSIGVGAAGIATGFIAGAVMLNANNDLDARCKPDCPASERDTLSRFRTARSVSLAGYAAGTVGLGLGLLLLLEGDSEPEAPLTSTWLLGPRGGLVEVGGAF